MTVLFLKTFLIGFLLNLLWETLHCQLYTTCHQIPKKKLSRLIVLMAAKDGFFITLFFALSVFIFQNRVILENMGQLASFFILSLAFSFCDEKISLKRARWAYTTRMPTIDGVGITPLLEIGVTGVLTFLIVFGLLA